MTAFFQLADNAFTAAPNGSLNNTTNPLTINGINTTRFETLTTGYIVSIWDNVNYTRPYLDPKLEKAYITALTIGVSGSITLNRPNPQAHAGTPTIAVQNTSDHLEAVQTAINANETSIALKANTADLSDVALSGSYTDLLDKPTIPTNNNQLTNGAGYITDYTVTELDVTQHEAALTITESQISDLDKYSTGAVDALLSANAAADRNRTNHTGTQAIATVSGLQDALDSKSATSHIHDDRYYTETETNTLLDGKANTVHTHTESDIIDLGTYLENISSENIEELANVTVTTPSDGQVLKYASGVWVNGTDNAGAGGSSDHGDLTGLADDDHTQYALSDGTRGYFATVAQGTLADSALQPGDLATVATTGAYNDLSGTPDLSAFDDVQTYTNLAAFPATGETGYLYIANDTGYLYRWNGSSYTQLTDQTAIWGQISGTLSNQTDLQSALDAKATPADITSAISAIDYPVDSVNGQVNAVVLNADDIDDTATTNKFTTGTDITRLANTSGTNTGDQDLSGYATTSALATNSTNDRARANHTGTQTASTISDFDTAVAANSAVAANTAKVTNATHTGDATGATALTLATVNSNVGSFGSASSVATQTVNAKGLTTAAASVAIQIAQSQVTDLVSDLSGKQATLVSGTNIKTINSTSLLGSGDIVISGGGTNYYSADSYADYTTTTTSSSEDITLPSSNTVVNVAYDGLWLADTEYSQLGTTLTITPTQGVVTGQLVRVGQRIIGADTAAGLDDLSDVDTSTVAPTDGQSLVYESSSSLWKPGTVSGGGGSTAGLSCALLASALGSDSVPQQTYAHAVISETSGDIDRMSCYIDVHSGTSNIEMGIYNAAGALLSSGVALVGGTGKFDVSFGSTVTIAAGALYYLAIVNQNNNTGTEIFWANNAAANPAISRIVGGTTTLASTLGAGSQTGRTYCLTAWKS